MKYIIAGARIGLTVNAALMVYAFLTGIENALMKRFIKKMKNSTGIKEEAPDMSDDLK